VGRLQVLAVRPAACGRTSRALADGHTKVLPLELAQRDDLGQGPFIGSGPWVLDTAEPGRAFVFSANPTYFEPSLPPYTRLQVQVLPDETTRRAAFLTQTLDIDEVPASHWASFRQSHPQAGHLVA
jgi:ABC-type oligopeptide transport system substrate-binding subunit